MKKLLLIAILISTNTTYAQGLWIEGSVDCGVWVKARKADRAQYFEHYLMGVVNGLVLGAAINIWREDEGNNVSRDQLYLWMDGWCQRHPLSSIHIGATHFADERTNNALANKLRRN